MSKQWFYEIMGTAVGPVSSADLKLKAQQGQVLPETRVRSGVDGPWMTADRVKGLLDPVVPAAAAKPRPQVAPVASPVAKSRPGAPVAAMPIVVEAHLPQAVPEPTMHLVGNAPEHHQPGDEAHAEYDFFRFVGFEEALGVALHKVFCDYCDRQCLTMTEATRRAIAALVNRRDLSGEPPPPVDSNTAPEVPSPVSSIS